MRIAVRNNPARQPVARATQVPFPVKGWTVQDSPVNAEKGTALVLDNWFPEAEGGRLRRGTEVHASGLGASVQSLLVYTSASASKMFGAAGSAIYDVSSVGVVGAAAVSGLTSAQWQQTMFATAAGQFLVVCNGNDDVRNYDGASWSTPTITGVSSSTLVHVTAHKFRLWFVQTGSTDLWYLATNAVAGSATKFSLGGLLKRGGYIMAVATWSVDSGAGMDDMFVAWSSEGELVVYQGTDPADADTWALVGVYRTSKPLGRRCMVPVGGDVAMISEDGILPISLMLQADRAVVSGKALTAKIRQAYADAVKRSRDAFGWEIAVHPARNMALVNVPGGGGEATVQFALNTITGAWCRFRDMVAICWAQYDNNLYYGTASGIVMHADTGGLDDGHPIEAVCLPAYMDLGASGRQKMVTMVQPIFTSDIAGLAPSVSVAVDYALPTEVTGTSIDASGYFTWGVSTWGGPDVWFGSQTFTQWRGNGNIGAVVSPYTTVAVDASEAGEDYRFYLTGWTMVYQTGGIL